MAESPDCQGCQNRDSCKETYNRLGARSIPPMTWYAMKAFAIPLALFVLCLAVFEGLLDTSLGPGLCSALGLSVALIMTLGWGIAARALSARRRHEERCPQEKGL